jgi:hypothetical protein
MRSASADEPGVAAAGVGVADQPPIAETDSGRVADAGVTCGAFFPARMALGMQRLSARPWPGGQLAPQTLSRALCTSVSRM